MAIKNVVVTGAAGQLGSCVVSNLINKGHRVTAFDKVKRAGLPFCISYLHHIPNGYLWPDDTDVVVHLAGHRDPFEPNALNLIQLYESNLESVAGTLHACRLGVKHVIFISSMSVYDPNETIPSTEGSKINPQSQYGFSKWLGEQACLIFKKNRPSCGLTILRLAQVYGPGSSAELAIYRLIRQALDLDSIELRCDSGLVRDFIYLDDAIEAIGLAIQHCPEGIYNVNGGSPVSMGGLVDLIEGILGTSLPKRFGNSGDQSRALDMEKFKQATGFQPMVSMKEGLKREIQRLKFQSNCENREK